MVVAAAAIFALEMLIRWTSVADKIAVPLLLPDDSGSADALVLLGASVNDYCTPATAALRRTMLAARLFRAGRAPRLVITGGLSRSRTRCTLPVAQVMANLAAELGVPQEAILVEDKAQDTWQNAVDSEPALRSIGAHRILLVTDSLHMRRAEACFRARGFETLRASVPAIDLYSNNVDLLRVTIHEYLGLLYYRFKGYTSGQPS